MILVVGAAGQLGSRIVQKLAESGQPVRAFVRTTSNYAPLQNLPGVEVVFGDLRDPASLDKACAGVSAVLTTANVVLPSRKDYSFEQDEGQGHRNLVAACKKAGVGQIILASVPVTPIDNRVPTAKQKRAIEKAILESGVPYTIFRLSVFLDSWLVLSGGALPLRGTEPIRTLKRDFWFAKRFLKAVNGMIDKRGIALVTGNGKSRQAFVTLDDVATMMARAVGHPGLQCSFIEVGGPEIMSWRELFALYGRVIGRKVRIMGMPIPVARAMQGVLGLFSPAAANLMGLNRLTVYDTPYDMTELAKTFGIRLKSAEEYLREKAALPAL